MLPWGRLPAECQSCCQIPHPIGKSQRRRLKLKEDTRAINETKWSSPPPALDERFQVHLTCGRKIIESSWVLTRRSSKRRDCYSSWRWNWKWMEIRRKGIRRGNALTKHREIQERSSDDSKTKKENEGILLYKESDLEDRLKREKGWKAACFNRLAYFKFPSERIQDCSSWSVAVLDSSFSKIPAEFCPVIVATIVNLISVDA